MLLLERLAFGLYGARRVTLETTVWKVVPCQEGEWYEEVVGEPNWQLQWYNSLGYRRFRVSTRLRAAADISLMNLEIQVRTREIRNGSSQLLSGRRQYHSLANKALEENRMQCAVSV